MVRNHITDEKQVSMTVLHGILMISKRPYVPFGPERYGAQVRFQNTQLQRIYRKKLTCEKDLKKR